MTKIGIQTQHCPVIALFGGVYHHYTSDQHIENEEQGHKWVSSRCVSSRCNVVFIIPCVRLSSVYLSRNALCPIVGPPHKHARQNKLHQKARMGRARQ